MIHKQYLTDENQKPVAVVIAYKDWLVIEKQLELGSQERSDRINALAGSLKFPMNGMEFQEKVRAEWDQ
jgi:hypothetical protein